MCSKKRENCIVLNFVSLDEFYLKIIKKKLHIDVPICKDEPAQRNDIVRNKILCLYLFPQMVLVKVLDDLKFDELFVKVSLLNTDNVLKVDIKELYLPNSSVLSTSKDIIPAKHFGIPRKEPNVMNFQFKIFEMEYKYNEPDSSDGLYYVELFDYITKLPPISCKESNDRFEIAKNSEISFLFHKPNQSRQYSISNPIFKKKPVYINEPISVTEIPIEDIPLPPTTIIPVVNVSQKSPTITTTNATINTPIMLHQSHLNTTTASLQSPLNATALPYIPQTNNLNPKLYQQAMLNQFSTPNPSLSLNLGQNYMPLQTPYMQLQQLSFAAGYNLPQIISQINNVKQ